MLEFKLVAHFIGNIFKWILNLGTKSIDEISKEDNSILGFIVIIILVFAFLGFKK
jgi:hypothetical protein